MPSNGLDCGLCADSHLDRLAEGLADTGGSRADEDHETRRQSSMNQRPSLMFIKDLQGRYVHVNDSFARAFALDPKGIISHTDAQLFPRRLQRSSGRTTLGRLLPVVQSRSRKSRAMAMARGTPASFKNFRCSTVMAGLRRSEA